MRNGSTLRAAMLLGAILWIAPCTAAFGQQPVTDVLLGAREFHDGTGMLVLELRGGIAPRGWPIRPTAGVAAATDIYGTQLEVMLGAQADVAATRRVLLTGGAGVAHVSQDGGEWNSGSSSGAYVNGAVLVSVLTPGLLFGLDARYLAAPDFTRADGLRQGVAFLQYSFIVRIDFGRGLAARR